jgi:hypothetical protein
MARPMELGQTATDCLGIAHGIVRTAVGLARADLVKLSERGPLVLAISLGSQPAESRRAAHRTEALDILEMMRQAGAQELSRHDIAITCPSPSLR